MAAINWSTWVDSNNKVQLTDAFCEDEQKLRDILLDLSMLTVTLSFCPDTRFYLLGRRIANRIYEYAKKIDDGYFVFTLDCFRNVDDIGQSFTTGYASRLPGIVTKVDTLAEYVILTRYTVKMDFIPCAPFLITIENLQKSGNISLTSEIIGVVWDNIKEENRGMHTKRAM